MKIGTGPILLLTFLLAGCAESQWVRDQYQQCYTAGGTGDYSRVTFMFVCWKRTEPPSRKKKLYELRYR